MGGGEPDAAETSEEGLRGTGGGRDGRGEGLEGGEEAKGLGEVSESMLVTVVGGQCEFLDQSLRQPRHSSPGR